MKQKHFVVIGGGITGMDAVSYLLTKKNEKICDGWEKIWNCIDNLYTCSKLHDESDENKSNKKIDSDFFQRGFHEREKEGRIYRLDPSIVPI